MTTIRIRSYMKGDKAFRRADNILSSVPIVTSRVVKELSKRTQISMKLRAPKDSGDLRRSISVKPVSRNRMEIVTGTGLDRPYDICQDQSFDPHWIHISQVKQGTKLKNWMLTHNRIFHKVRKWDSPRGFVDPTIDDYLIPNAPRIIKQVWDHVQMERKGG